ncbi:hypothetical protein VTG60DRAFT_2683 [Thermothelomyces hinnuleus]
MTPSDDVARDCLGIAIDHRIRGLIRRLTRKLLERLEVSPNETPARTHISVLEEYGRELGRSDDEIRVTTQLAEPATTGGILVAIQQPGNSHPFEQRIETVIRDSPTLAALDDAFRFVSLETLDVRRNVAVIDLLQFITEKQMEKMNDPQLRDAFQTTMQILMRKKPDIVVCCGKIRFRSPTGEEVKREDLKGEAVKFETQGVGEVFEEPTTEFEDESHNWVSTERVNGFHPGYCMNRRPHLSCLRQLLILTVADACGRYWGNWTGEEDWMKRLRASCASRAREKTRRIYLPEYGRMYSGILKDVQKAVGSLSRSKSLFYDDLLRSDLSTKCNDANLILLQMSVLRRKGWPEHYDEENQTALRQAAHVTKSFLKNVSGRQVVDPQLHRIWGDFVSSLRQRVNKITEDVPSADDLITLRECFLDTARDLEALLGELLESELTASDSETEADSVAGSETEVDLLAGQMENLTV